MPATKRVLVIEDDVFINQILCEILRQFITKYTIEIHSAFDGRQGLNKYRTNNFDLIILDIMMPVMNGEAFLKRARPKVPVIVVSALSKLSDFVNQHKCIKKPMELDHFITTVEAALSGESYEELQH